VDKYKWYIIKIMSTAQKKIKNEPVKIMVFGTFDGLHRGHIYFFKKAKFFAKSLLKRASKNPYLVVSIARDKNVKRIKGANPSLSEKERLSLVATSSIVDKVVLGGVSDHIPHIVRERPDMIALGYDQNNYVKNLRKDLKNAGLLVKIVKIAPYKEHIYKNSLLKNKKR
jgi:FAD synthetase